MPDWMIAFVHGKQGKCVTYISAPFVEVPYFAHCNNAFISAWIVRTQ